MIIEFIISVLGNWAAGALAHSFLGYLRQKREEGKIKETLNELCIEYQLKDDFKEELKKLLKEYYTKKSMEFINRLNSLLKNFGAQIAAEKFIKEFFVKLTIRLANRYEDYIDTIIEFVKLEELEKLSEEYSELKPILKKYKDEYEAKKASFIIGDLNSIIKEIKEIEPFPYYIEREEVKELQETIKEKDIIIIIGRPGAGKSTMLKHSLEFFKDFSNFVWIKSFYRYDSHGHVLRAELNNLDNFVIVWDDMHLFEEEDIIPTLLNILDLVERNNKKFKFIGCSRIDISLDESQIPSEKIKVIELKSFNKLELVEKCREYFKVKLAGVNPEDILKIGDGTPLYIISFFIKFKDETITHSDLMESPRDVIELWKSYITKLQNAKKLGENHRYALRSIALLRHTSSKIKIAEIDIVYKKVFRASGIVDRDLLEYLNKLNLVTMHNDSCSMHDAHAEAVDRVFKLDSTIIRRFVKIIDINKLGAFSNWIVKKRETERSYDEYLLIVANRILELNKRDSIAWQKKGNALYEMGKYDEAVECFMKTVSLYIISEESEKYRYPIPGLLHFIEKYRYPILGLLHFIIKNSKNEEIKAEAIAIGITLLYLYNVLPEGRYIKELDSLKKTPRIEALISTCNLMKNPKIMVGPFLEIKVQNLISSIKEKLFQQPGKEKDVVDEVFALLIEKIVRKKLKGTLLDYEITMGDFYLP
jgi:energy-coupling factor transporter ATP-binding protein EcfA2